MDIVLVNPPTLHRGSTLDVRENLDASATRLPYYSSLLAMDASKRDGFSTLPGEHLGLQSLQAKLETEGHHVVIVNACVMLHDSLRHTLAEINRWHFDLLGFSGPHDVFAENLWLARAVRQTGFTGHITLGHDFATLNHETILQLCPEFDSVVRGEGEITFCELACALEVGSSLSEVDGLTFRGGQGIVVNRSRTALILDDLPPVTRHDLPHVLQHGMAASLFTKRGCPYQCTFCTTGQVPNVGGLLGAARWRMRAPESVVDEMGMLADTYGVRWLTIVDDLYLTKGTVGARHALEIAETMLQRGLSLDYMIDCRVDSIDRSVMQTLRRSGLRKVFIGVESASEVALKTFRKGYSPDIIRQKLHVLEELDLEIILGYIFFSPLDTLQGLEQSYLLVRDLDIRDVGLFLQSVRIYPGTTLYHDLARRNLLDGEFPYFSARYQDVHVDRLRNALSGFASVAVPIMRVVGARDPKRAKMLQEETYFLVRQSLGSMIEHCKRDEFDRVEDTSRELVAAFAKVAGAE